MAQPADTLSLADELNRFIETREVDLWGVAPVSSYEGAMEQMHPRYWMKDATAVIVLGLQVPKAILDQVERKTSPYPYLRFAKSLLNDELDMLANQVSRFLVRKGYNCLPTPAAGTPGGNGRFLLGGKIFGYRSLDLQATKTFKLAGDTELYARIDIINVLNFDNFSNLNYVKSDGKLLVSYNETGDVIGTPRQVKAEVGFRF